MFDWEGVIARDKQCEPPGDWRVWLLLAGRGFGKTRTGAEIVRSYVERGLAYRVALVARTVSDVRDVIVEGESGILAVSPPWFLPKWEPSKRRLTWPNGAIATTYSGDVPDQLRGPQHDFAWADELAAWRYPETWDQLLFGLRLGANPRCVVTTTPRPVRVIRDLVKRDTTHVTRGSTYENRSNLADAFFEAIISRYEGTRTGRQELYADLLEEAEGALWNRTTLENTRVTEAPDLARIIVAIDPAVTSSETSDETGIVAAGRSADGQGYVLSDISGRYAPNDWAQRALNLLEDLQGDKIVGEANNGGDMIEHTLRTIDKNVSYKKVTASRGKQTRAEPISSLYNLGKIHHVGIFPDLEDQLCNWEPLSGDKSPDRLDALVWALTELFPKRKGPSWSEVYQ
jgi:phage terminase large subunit-like protein